MIIVRHFGWVSAALSIGLFFASVPTYAQVKVGVTLSTTGPAASLGIPEKNTLELVAGTPAAKNFQFIFLDDASDTTAARRNTEKLTTENGVDVIIGSSTSPNSLAMLEVASKSGTPMISVAAASRIIAPMDNDRKWIFKTAFGSLFMANVAVNHMKKNGVKKLAFIGYNDAYGEDWWKSIKESAEKNGVEIVASERYNPTDTSVTAQILKIVSTSPDAVLIGASGTPAVLPQAALLERGFKGRVYQNQGVINADYLRLGGKTVEGTFLPSSPAMVSNDLADSNPAKASAASYKKLYEDKYGANSLSGLGANAYDAWLIIQNAAAVAEKSAKPGTPEFRKALRDAIEGAKDLKSTGGLINMTADDHFGFSMDAPVVIKVEGGTWVLAK
ncbi:MAG: ABC transporter substrate-binding protein [Afipia sp.]|nr:ABC transporter substrate-binding protein [Afipia sp.]